ncbi:MAG: VaFE repeat-containing surface-anchored protein [Saccharofermentans sp.]|nr:VaFE repeat-containing surface-anchored protein [Saccharofermentans sp.]
MGRYKNKIKAGSFVLSVLMLFWFIGINSVNAATDYTPLVHKDDYDFTANAGYIEEWFTYTAEGEVTSHIISAASSYSGTPYSSMDCAQFVAKVLLDAGSIDFGGYLACDGNMQVSEFLKLFAGEIPTGIDGRTVNPVNGSEVIDAASMSPDYINAWCANNCKPADLLVFYGEDGNDLHIGIFSEVRDGVAYMWHSGSSRGVCEVAVSNIIKTGKVGHTITYMQRFRTSADTKAYTTLWINKVTGDGTPLGGAVYNVYSDQALTNQIGQLIDDNNNGSLSTPFELTKEGSDFTGTFYIKETVAPSVLITGSDNVDLTCGLASVQDEYLYLDNAVYKVDMRLSGANTVSGTMDYCIYRITGSGEELLLSEKLLNYPLSGSVIVIGNLKYPGAPMADTLSLDLEKTTANSFDVTTTLFTLKSSGNVVATYSYESGKWVWKDKNGNVWNVSSFPLKANTAYTVEETFTVPSFDCYDGNKIAYQVKNTQSGWTKQSDNTYMMSFTTGDIGGSSYGFKAQNDNEESSISLTKQVVETSDSKDGFKFELWDQTGSILLAKGTSDSQGKVLWESGSDTGVEVLTIPAGQYQLREMVPDSKTYGNSKAVYTYDVPSGFSASADGSYWYKTILASSGVSVVQTVSNDRCQANIEVTKIAEDDKDDGLKFELYYGGKGTEPSWSFELVDTAVTDSNGKAVFEDLPLGWYKIKEIIPEGYECSWVGAESGGYKVVQLTDSSDNQTVGITAINLINTQIIIEKQDEWSGNTISMYSGSPVKFRIYEDKNANGQLDGTEADSYVEINDADLDGVITVTEAGSGAYLLEEMIAPNGYYKAADLIPVIVDSASKVSVTVSQTPYAEKVVVYKFDSVTGEAVQGAVFTIYEDTNNDGIHQDNEPVAQTYDSVSGTMKNAAFTEISAGKYESDVLRAGSYVAVETVLPSGYFYSDKDGKATSEANSYAFTIEAKDTGSDDFSVTDTVIYAENVPGGVLVYKVNDSGNMLSGASFCVYSDIECQSQIGELKDDGNGCYSYYGLDAGKYYLAETKAPDGYMCDKNVYEFSVSCDKSTAVITNAFAKELAQEGNFCDPLPITGTILADTTTDSLSKTKMLSYGKQVELKDYVACSGLNTGDTYKLTGTLVLKSTGEALKDANGKEVVSETVFTATSAFMTVEVEFAIDTTSLEGESLVAFEVLEDQDGNKYYHEDIDDEGQTLTMPDIKTIASDADTGTSVMLCSEVLSINDEVSFQGLEKGCGYKVSGCLVDKNTGETIKDTEGNTVVAKTEFIAAGSSGTVNVKFEDVYIPYEITDLVVFERLYTDDDVLLVVHEDINDTDQTIIRALLETSAEENTTGKAVMMNSVVTVVDKVDYTGLIPGNSYVIEATLYKNTGEAILANGQPVVNNVEFTTDSSDGTILVPVTFDTTGLNEGEVVVVFESVKDVATEAELAAGVQKETVEVSRHADLQSKSQSLTVKAVPATGEGISRYAVIGGASALTGGIVALALIIRKKKREE